MKYNVGKDEVAHFEQNKRTGFNWNREKLQKAATKGICEMGDILVHEAEN